MSKKSNHYINGKEFYNDLKDFLIAKKDNNDLEIPPHVIRYFVLLAKKYINNHKWFMYDAEIKSLMVSEGVYACCRYITKFDYEKYDSPFNYFTTFLRNGFFKIYNMEKKNSKIKKELIDDYVHNGDFNNKLKDIVKNDYNNVVISNAKRENQDKSEFLPLTVYKNGKKTIIETEEEWSKQTYKKVMNKFGSVNNLPKYKKFGDKITEMIRETIKKEQIS